MAGGTSGPLFELATARQQAVVASGGDWESVNTISEMSSASFVIRVERVKVRTRGHSNDLGPKPYPLK